MSRILKVISNEEIRIEEYKNPRFAFNDYTYQDYEDYCTLKEKINPFQMFYENQKLKNKIDKAIKYIKENEEEYGSLEDNEKIILGILKGEDNE